MIKYNVSKYPRFWIVFSIKDMSRMIAWFVEIENVQCSETVWMLLISHGAKYILIIKLVNNAKVTMFMMLIGKNLLELKYNLRLDRISRSILCSLEKGILSGEN